MSSTKVNIGRKQVYMGSRLAEMFEKLDIRFDFDAIGVPRNIRKVAVGLHGIDSHVANFVTKRKEAVKPKVGELYKINARKAATCGKGLHVGFDWQNNWRTYSTLVVVWGGLEVDYDKAAGTNRVIIAEFNMSTMYPLDYSEINEKLVTRALNNGYLDGGVDEDDLLERYYWSS